MSLCIANYVRIKIYEKWSTAHRFMRILEQQLMFIHTYFAAAMICSSLSSSFSWDCWLSPNGFRNRIFPSSSEGYLIVFFYLFTSWQDIFFFSFRASLTKWLFVFRNLLRPASDLRDLWFHTHLQIRLADDTNSTSQIFFLIPWKSSGLHFLALYPLHHHWLKASCSRTFWGKGSSVVVI